MPRSVLRIWTGLLVAVLFPHSALGDDIPEPLRRWMVPQNWNRAADVPVLREGNLGEFDDGHIFAPNVARLGNRYMMWYCGARGTVAERVFKVGLALSSDGVKFIRYAGNPVIEFHDKRYSVVTPCVLRDEYGSVNRNSGAVRMWFCATELGSGKHSLHSVSSRDGVRWSSPSEALLDNVFSPHIIQEGDTLHMWYTDVSVSPWRIRHATSDRGLDWDVDRQPCLEIDQSWEHDRLFYPSVIKQDDVYLMWYGSYWTPTRDRTAIGFAASLDGSKWYKSTQNPVLRPEPDSTEASHYTTSQSVIPLSQGGFRMYYATRKPASLAGPNYAISTASWKGLSPP